ncbi:MAG: hypothetical protein JW874_11495 [Spirochaetales bacterium]|nr:hypothetical protein [Spirochaetales bacterium]
MNQENQNSRIFIERLLANPGLASLNPLQKEIQILQFLNTNRQQLFPTLSSEGFFPGKAWNEIFSLLYDALVQLINESLFPLVASVLSADVDYSFMISLGQQSFNKEHISKTAEAFIQKMLGNNEVRREYSVIMNILPHEFIEKYLHEIFETKSYIFFELTKVQKLKMDVKQVINMLKICILLRPAIHFFNNGSFHTESAVVLIPLQQAKNIEPLCRKDLPGLPEEITASAIHSNVSFLDNQYLEATARISSIITLMYKNFRSDMKVDRGAVSPEKSWINIARRNYKFLGLDIKMLDEFYKYAAENNW